MNKKMEEKTMELRAWVHEELEPYFQGEFGTMDTMLEMFIEQLTDKLSSLIDEEKGKKILDACCGGRMFWFNKHHPNALYIDKRIHIKGENKHRPNFTVQPDMIVDFRKMPFEDKSFKLVVFDPPHAFNLSKGSVIGDYYGALSKDTWEKDIKAGFDECWRVLEDDGVLIFKWNEVHIKRGELLKVIDKEPLFGHRPGGRGYGGTHWLCFMKFPTTKL